MIDHERQRKRAEELKRKILSEKKSSTLQEDFKGTIRPEEQRVTIKEPGNLMQGNKSEDNMWEARGHAESDADQRASEEAQRRLQALERELRVEEEQRQMDRARLRAEELKKKLSEEAERKIPDQSKGDIKIIPPEPSETSVVSHGNSSQIYLEALQLAYRDGKLSKVEAEILALLRERFGLTEKEHNRLQQKVQLEIYSEAMVAAWRNGVVTQEDVEKLDLLREQLNISAEDHLRFERQARRQALRRDAFGAQSDARV